ncbi:MAG: FHA domain-containing protein [Kiritimatiellae bacterium]|nr:FHA domain-containing protein [Kiritimatiellia bacterium]
MADGLELLVANGELAGRRYTVGPGGLRFGRSSSNDIHVNDEELSRNHCLFEAAGETGLRVMDLASANGTLLNGRLIGGDPQPLRAGDVIEVGKTVVKVVGDESQPAMIDLGLGSPDAPAQPGGRGRSPVAGVLWVVAVVVMLAAIAAALFMPRGEEAAPAQPVADEAPSVREVFYEKVEANSEGIFRYALSLSEDGTLSVSVDDVPKNDRRFTKSEQLGEAGRAELNDILSFERIGGLDREYAGPEPDPPALDSWELRVVYSTRALSVRVVNAQEPEAFRAVREKLEAFSKNQLGVWAIQYSREKLVALAEESAALGRAKWEDRDVNHGNLFAAVSAYREALFYLETVNPKPECAAVARQGLETAKAELDRRYGDQRFAVDKALNQGLWEEARRELGVLLEMVPDRADDRHREAAAKLVDVERRMKGGK